jgi:lysophospholipase L1-like esterase
LNYSQNASNLLTKSFLNTQNPRASELIARFPPPAMIIIQLGSNDLGTSQSIDLIQNIERDILWLRLLLPA